MAVIKYPNYLEEQLKLKLKEFYSSENSNRPVENEVKKLKLSNVSEEVLDAAVNLAKRDLKERNVHDILLTRNRKSAEPNALNFERIRFKQVDHPLSARGSRVDVKVKSSSSARSYPSSIRHLPVRSLSPPTRDENPNAAKHLSSKVSRFWERGTAVEVGKLKEELKKCLLQMSTLASVKANRIQDQNEDPSDVHRRKVRISERSSRISRLAYDLDRGTKELLSDIRKGRRQESLKKLTQCYKGAVKTMKMIVQQMSDHNRPSSFLCSKFFPDLVRNLRELVAPGIELDVDRGPTNSDEDLAFCLENILISRSNNQPNAASTNQQAAAPPPSPNPFVYDLNNNTVSVATTSNIVTSTAAVSRPVSSAVTATAGRVLTQAVSAKVLNDSENRSTHSAMLEDADDQKVHEHLERSENKSSGNFESNKKRLLSQWLKVLAERNIEGKDRQAVNAVERQRSNLSSGLAYKDKKKLKVDLKVNFQTEQEPVRSKVMHLRRLPGQSGLIKTSSKGRLIKTGQTRSEFIDLNSLVRPTFSRLQKSLEFLEEQSFLCCHRCGVEDVNNRRSASSPPKLLRCRHFDEDYKDAERSRHRSRSDHLGRTSLDGVEHRGRVRSRFLDRIGSRQERMFRSKSLPHRMSSDVCLKCRNDAKLKESRSRTWLDSDDASFGEEEDGHDSSRSGTPDADDGAGESGLEKLRSWLEKLELERIEIKRRWNTAEVGNGGGGDNDNKKETNWMENGRFSIKEFHSEFKRDVTEAKKNFQSLAAANAASGPSVSTEEFSLNLLQEWERRDKDFFSFNLFNGEISGGQVMSSLPLPQPLAQPASPPIPQYVAPRSVKRTEGQTANLAIDRDILSDVIKDDKQYGRYVRDVVRSLVGGRLADSSQAVICDRVADDVLNSCLNDVYSEVNAVSDAIVERVYKSELSAETGGSAET